MLRIMTLNINYYGTQHGPWDVRQQIIQQAIEAAQPDIIALQAVAQDPAVAEGEDQAAQLANELSGYTYHLYCPTQSYPDGRVEGMALLSRLRPAATHHLELSLRPGLDDTSPRILVHACFDLADGPLHLFNAHFSWVAEQTSDNLDEVLPYLQTFAGPALLLGDLNTAPDSPLMDRFRQEDWIDSWDHLYGPKNLAPDAGYTFVENGKLAKRIDYVWLRDGLQTQLKEIERVADQPTAAGHRASDHLGLVVTLDWEI